MDTETETAPARGGLKRDAAGIGATRETIAINQNKAL